MRRIAHTLLALLFVVLVQSIAMLSARSYGYIEFSPPAKWVMQHAPGLYHPEPEIFAERLGHHDNYIYPDQIHPPALRHEFLGEAVIVALLCQATVGLRIQVPTEAAMASLRVQPVPGWTATLTNSELAEPLEAHGQEITSYVSVVEFRATGAGIAPGEFQEFALSGGPFPEVDELSYPAVQSYSDGTEAAWIEPAVDGEEPETSALLGGVADDPQALSYLVASAALLTAEDRQALLAESATRRRLAMESRLLRRELTLLRTLGAVPVPLRQFATPMTAN